MGADTDLIRGQIARTRDEMGAIIDAIAYKADVQARAKDRVSGAVDRVKDAVSGTASSIKERAGRDGG
jgi:LPS O-antigen subunit length determinant protein (WzzB/FepE family)